MTGRQQVVLVVSGARVGALPVGDVQETMRPLPVTPVAGAPACVRGVAIIRGVPVPVIDLGAVLGALADADVRAPARRFVTIKVDRRVVALAVDEVIGVRWLDAGELTALPPLLGDAGAEAIEAIGRLDARLLVILHTAQLVPAALLAQLDAEVRR